MDFTNPPSGYEPPADDQIIVWVQDASKLFIRGIYDELYATSAEQATYREFVNLVGEQAAEMAVRQYRQMDQEDAWPLPPPHGGS
jgi:hypothetical protein